MIEEVVRRKSRTPSEGLKELLKQKMPEEQRSEPGIQVEYEFVVKTDPTRFAECPIIDTSDGHYFCTFDGRDLMFDPNQTSPYIFLPFPLRKAIFHRSGDKLYFITLDTSNKLQYSLLVNGYPSEERYVISRNVQKVTKQSNKIFYVSTKNELSYINMVVEDNGVLRGRMCTSGIKSKAGIDIFYASSTLFMNTEYRFRREDGKELPVQGDRMCEMGGKILVLDRREKESCIFLLDEKYCLASQLKIPAAGRASDLFPLGNIAGIVAEEVLYLVSERNGELCIAKEVDLKTRPLCISLYLKEDIVRISEIIVGEDLSSKESGSSVLKDFNVASNSSVEKNRDIVESALPGTGNVKIESSEDGYDTSPDKFFLVGSGTPYANLLLGNHASEEGHRMAGEGNVFSKEDVSVDSFSPYMPDKNDSEEIRRLDEKIDMVLRAQKEIGEKMSKIERDNSERFKRLLEMLEKSYESKKTSGTQMFSAEELPRMVEILNNLEARLRSETSNESKVLDCVKKIILGTLVPAVEAAMDEIRIQMINEIRLIHNEDHLKNVKRAVDGLHSSFNKQNEIKGLISEGLIEEAAEIAIKGSESNLETFVSNVEISCLENLASSMLVALLERVLVIAKDDFKSVYQNFTYMAMMCLEPNDLNDEEVQVLEILMTYINNIEDLTLSDVKGLPVILDFQRLKLNKIKDKRGIK
ncbi:hypothetical protein KMI_12g18090 [Encephalitozoon hellem]|nr:hypothetical protein KMI_12g18090 [Encephalitozoon hellem]